MTPVRELDLRSIQGKRILVVDDMKDNRTVGSLFLKKAGADVVLATNGQEAVETALQENPDAVLMDVHMPILDGLAAAAELRRKGFFKPIIMVTADCRAGLREKAFSMGANSYLSKPVGWAQLLKILNQFCADAPYRHLH